MLDRTRLAAVVAIGIALVLATMAPAQDLVVSGVTYKFDNTGKYAPLGNVSIQAYRNMAPILKTPFTSDPTDGTFRFAVPAGDPFEVCFHGAKKVPTLKSLAGVGKVKNEVHVVLLTKEQYEKSAIGKQFPLEKKLDCILMQLPKEDDFTTKLRFDLRER